MFNIELDEKELEKLIEKLDNDNKTIVDAMNDIYSVMTQIDDTDWRSPEKERINNNFIPYIKEQETISDGELSAKTQILKDALAAYRKDNKDLTNETEKLEA